MAYSSGKGFRPKTWVKSEVSAKPRFQPLAGWNHQFRDAFDAAVEYDGHVVISARAGAGKTTALTEIVYRLREKYHNASICMVAFNSSIRDELKPRVAGVSGEVEVRTVHAHGFRAVTKAWNSDSRGQKREFDVEGTTGATYQKLAIAAYGDEKESISDRESLLSLVSLAKTRLANTLEELKVIATGWEIHSSDMNRLCSEALKILELTARQPLTGVKKSGGYSKSTKGERPCAVITFDDQVWLPVINNWPVDQFDFVLVDEAQDLSPARIELILRSLKPGGRIIAVGDESQAIYKFAGADVDALPQLIERLQAKVVPLSVSFRCSKAVVAFAQQWEPDIEAQSTAPEGAVTNIDWSKLPTSIKPGDTIVSRTNAPIVRLFFELLKVYANTGVPLRFIGRDFAEAFKWRILSAKRKHGGATFSVVDLFTVLDALVAERPNLADEVECIRIISDKATSVEEILDRLSQFSCAPDRSQGGGKDVDGAIHLSSTHRYKGLERRRVFMLADTFSAGVREEQNLCYVAATRAQEELLVVTGMPRRK